MEVGSRFLCPSIVNRDSSLLVDRTLGVSDWLGLSTLTHVAAWSSVDILSYLFGGRVETAIRGGLCLCWGVTIDLQRQNRRL